MPILDSASKFRVIFVGDVSVGKESLVNRYVNGQMEKQICGIGVDFAIKRIELEGKDIQLRIQSFDHVPRWLEEVAQYCDDDVSKVLVANKCDLATDRVVEHTAGQKYADSLGMPFLETSAKENTNVDAAFMTLAREILDRKRPEVEAEILLNASKQPKPGGCCYSSV